MTDQLVPAECAVKVFKTTLVDFKNRAQYVKGDVRFFKDDFKKHNPRRIIKIWAEKEDHNLRRCVVLCAVGGGGVSFWVGRHPYVGEEEKILEAQNFLVASDLYNQSKPGSLRV